MRKAKFLVVYGLVLNMIFSQLAFAATSGQLDSGRSGAFSNPTQTMGARDYKTEQVIFRTNKGSDNAKILKKYNLKVLRRNTSLGYILAQTPKGFAVEKLVQRLNNEGSIDYAQPNYTYKPLAQVAAQVKAPANTPRSVKPNDAQYGRQWALQKINAEQGWAVAKPANSVIIAILDTGVDVNHPDLKGRVVPGINTVNPLKSARDDEGHGTHVAGIAGAITNNGIGVAGISGARIMPVKVFDGEGGSDISIADGIIWAADHGAKVMNMSFGSFYRSQVLNQAIAYAYQKGVVMVAAAGNWASEELSSPATISQVIAVSATDRNDELAKFSSFGPEIDIAAPGDKIYSTLWDPYKGSTYAEMSGTSMASPMVAGLAAMLLAKNPKLSNDDVRQIIEASAQDLGEPGWDPKFGHGRIDMYKALTLSLSSIDDANGSMGKAVRIQDGTPITGKIDFGSDEDWYQIALTENGGLDLEVSPAGKVSPGVEVYDGAGERIAAFNTSESGLKSNSFSAGGSIKVAEKVYGFVADLEPGTYYVKIFGNHFRWSDDNYGLKVAVVKTADTVKEFGQDNQDPENAAVISVGQKVYGAILHPGEEDWYRVPLNGRAFKVQLEVPEGLNLAVDFEAADAYAEENNQDSLKDWGSYFYQEIDNGKQGENEAGVIELDDENQGYYLVRVYETSGSSRNVQYALSINNFQITKDQYESNDSRSSATELAFGKTLVANFHQESDEDWYKVQVSQKGVLKVVVKQPSAYARYDLSLYAEQGDEPIGSAYDNQSMDSEDLKVKGQHVYKFMLQPGTYYLNMVPDGTAGADDYQISASFEPFDFVDAEPNNRPSQATPLQLNTPQVGTLYPTGDYDVYSFDVVSPQPYLVYLTPPADIVGGVVVMREAADEDASGEVKLPIDDVASDYSGEDGVTEPQVDPVAEIIGVKKGQAVTGVFVPSTPGRYYVLVGAVDGSSKGKYSLTVKPFKAQGDAWEDNNTLAKAKPITNGALIKPTFMPTEDVDCYKINVPGKGKLTVSLAVPDDIDGVIEIYNATGKLISKVDQAMSGEGESAYVTITQPGMYFVRVYDYLGNSSVLPYSLTVKYTLSK